MTQQTPLANVVQAVRATPSVRRVIYTSSQLVCDVGHLPRHDTDYRPTTLCGQSKVTTERVVRAKTAGEQPGASSARRRSGDPG